MAARIYESTNVVELENSAQNLIASWDTLIFAGCKCIRFFVCDTNFCFSLRRLNFMAFNFISDISIFWYILIL